MKNISLMPIVLALTMGLVGSNLHAGESKPTPSPAPTPTLAESAGEAAAKAGTDFLKGLGGTAANTAVKTGMAAAGLPPLNLNTNINVNTNITNCLSGDTVNNVTGSNNQVQNVLTATCNRAGGATGDIGKFTLANNKTVAVYKVVDMPLLANTSYNFTFANGSASFAALIKSSVSGQVVTTYTTRQKARDRWTEHHTFGLEGNPYTGAGIAPMRVYPNGRVEIFFPNPVDPNNAIRFDVNVLNLRTPV